MDIPILHNSFINEIREILIRNDKFDALLGAGSMISNEMDQHSDIDLILVSNDKDNYQMVMKNRIEFANQIKGYLSGFTGEHVGEPRLLICLYQRDDGKLLHVDLKFIHIDDLINSGHQLIEKPVVLWERDTSSKIKEFLNQSTTQWPNRPPQWFEDRFWIWIHYGLTKIQRGELFEAIGMLSFIREQVLGPMILRRIGLNQRGVRKLEQCQSGDIKQLETTIPNQKDKQSLLVSLNSCMDLYLNLRNDNPPEQPIKMMPDILLKMIKE
eukprot:gene650-805_t